MQIEETLYKILLHTNINDLELVCQSNKQINSICNNPYFLQQKFKTLPFTIYKLMDQTLPNLLYINYLINVAYKLINLMINVIFLSKYDNIKELENTSPFIANKIMTQVYKLIKPDKNDQWFGLFEGLQYITYNVKDIEGVIDVTNDQKFYLNYWIYTPDSIVNAIDLSLSEMIEYLINIFLNHSFTAIGILQGRYVKINSVKKLEKFIDTKFIKLKLYK